MTRVWLFTKFLPTTGIDSASVGILGSSAACEERVFGRGV